MRIQAARRYVAPVALALALGCASDRDEDMSGGMGPGAEDGGDPGDDGGGDDGGTGGDDGDPGGGDDGDTTGDDGDTTGGDEGDTGDGGGAGPGCENGWVDPFPPMPDANSPDFPPGYHTHPGPISTYRGEQWVYSVKIPENVDDTSHLPVVFSTYIGELHDEPVIQLFLETEEEPGFGGPNPWWWDADSDVFCSPSCCLFHFIDVDGMIEILEDLAANVRFDHKRVIFASPDGARDGFTLALDTRLQPYFAGVGYWGSEWQQATCPDIDGPAECPPEIYFAMSGCDHSFCPTLECAQTVEARGWDADISMETTEAACPCPPPGGSPGDDRPHTVGRPAWAPYETWLMTTSRP